MMDSLALEKDSCSDSYDQYQGIPLGGSESENGN